LLLGRAYHRRLAAEESCSSETYRVIPLTPTGRKACSVRLVTPATRPSRRLVRRRSCRGAPTAAGPSRQSLASRDRWRNGRIVHVETAKHRPAAARHHPPRESRVVGLPAVPTSDRGYPQPTRPLPCP
jgi:hypothetical protein